MMWAPLSKPDRSEGEIVSPAWMKKALPLARSCLHHRRELGEAAAVLLCSHPVDVVRLHEADRDRLLGQRRRSGEEDGQANEAGAQRVE